MQNKLMEVRVVQKVLEAVDICSLELASVSGEPLPPFSAGAHIDLHIGGFVRQYSLCNNPAQQHRYQVAVLRDPNSRGGSAAVHARLAPEQIVQISAPRNHFSLKEDAPHSLLLAAGVGVTPLLSMAERLADSGAPFTMHYSARSRDRTAFRRRIE
ncbi:MAG: oxidoreductase, partial [Haliea sp.]